ncbi:Uma2 family endonuclease [Stratiformator vulcanicus]|uniref:Putative restriction endonuclease domain-containing protein n=1 Tax=Stratiformator vulcanicus TaxID=2527980 RepID=A0A517R6J8_9PLAN|nr:Uma2 family endonuclease [Stratiformator vulcanicus]QDT39526.1 hypothetical protein Pan189_39340 [Stratiformator vulcanicus]
MATATATTLERPPTIADLVEELGGIPADRILLLPSPGTAGDNELLAVEGRDALYELVDHVIVKKGAMAVVESRLAAVLLAILEQFLEIHRSGIVFGPDLDLRMSGGNVRKPDVSLALKGRFPDGRLPMKAIGEFGLDLAVEILSRSNTPAEMHKKRVEYFNSGCQLVWELNPRTRVCRVYSSADDYTELTEEDSLNGGDILPGFELSIKEWFRRAEEV